jgi:hypothetical protein
MRDPDLHLDAPDRSRAWERTQVTLSIGNRARQPILPLVLRLASPGGEIERWGIDGRIVRWGRRVPSRRAAAGWEVLVETSVQQLGPPVAAPLEARGDLVRIEPLPPSASASVQTSFDAAYAHSGELTASLTYVGIDPRRQAICAVDEASATTPFVPCRPVTELADAPGLQYYVPESELEHDRRSVTASHRFAVRHPDFDVDEARSLAGVAEGPFAYDPAAGRWILVDESRRETLVVGRDGPVASLPGDWLAPLTTLNSLPAASVTWRARSAEDAAGVLERLRALGVDASPESHKGGLDEQVVRLALRRDDVEPVAGLMRELGARL